MTDLRGLFVVGTDTGVGKTRVAAAIARSLAGQGLRVGVLKPLATGATRAGTSWACEDAEVLIAAIGGEVPLDRAAPLIYEEPLAPAVAARRLGRPLEARQVLEAVRESLRWWEARGVELMVVEGVGGLLTPLAEDMTLAELAVALDYPLVIVARRGLGTLNHTLLTVECARRRGLRIAGLVLNAPDPGPPGAAEATNAEELARRLGDIPVLADLPFHQDPAALAIVLGGVDWYDRSGGPRSAGAFFGGPDAPVKESGR